MKSYRKELWFHVPGRRAFINITPQVDECLRESGIQEGLCLVNAMHIIPRISINNAAGPEAADPRAGCTTAPAKCPEQSRGTMPTPREAGKGIRFPLRVMGRDAQRWWR